MGSLLRKQFNDYMIFRGYSEKTKEAYINAMAGLAGYYRQSPDKLGHDQIQAYLLYLIKERKLAWNTCNVVFSALRCFYTQVLKWEKTRFHIPPRPREKKLPQLLSVEEVGRILKSAANIKHRALLTTVYGGGLRVSEVVQLKTKHIESERMMIRVEQGKGRKDRYTLLPQSLLDLLRAYWKACRPDSWLFFTKTKEKPMHVSTAQKIYYAAKHKAGIHKGTGIHTLRHCFATHLLDQGVDIYTIKQLMGHTALRTTSRYLHTTGNKIAAVKSPLDTLDI
jgi:integrase/recombinase XerD